VRKPRDFRPEQLYAVTQRGNGGQWIYRDPQDFEQALAYMRKYTALHNVRIHGYCLMHNHSHWIFEASSPLSISNVMRDAQSRYSHYLNVKYRTTPWVLIAPLYGVKDIDHFAPYLRTGPVNWTPRFDARHLDAAGFREFLRYIENNPVKAGLAERAIDWPWSSAQAHSTGHDPDHLLTFDHWQHLFGNPETIVVAWQIYLNGPIAEARQNATRIANMHSGSRLDRPRNWAYNASPPVS
jgi:putative transposase